MKYIINIAAVVALFAVNFISFSACKKPEEPVVVEDTTAEFKVDFDYTGELYIHTPVQFKSNLKEKKEITFNFGNLKEETLFGTGTTYTYTQAGTYNVVMAVVDGFGGTASKTITITNGIKRVEGTYKWTHLLYRVKNGFPNGIPNISFEKTYSLNIVDDSTIQIPDIAQLPYRGPYTVKLKEITENSMYLESDDGRESFGFNYDDFSGTINIKHVRNDTTWRIQAGASLIK